MPRKKWVPIFFIVKLKTRQKEDKKKNNSNFNFSYLEISALNNQPFARKALILHIQNEDDSA